MTDRQLPANIEIERFIAGCFIIEDDEIIQKYAQLLRMDDFTDKVCKNVIGGVCQLLKEGKHVDLIMLSQIYPNHDAEMAKMMAEVTTCANIEGYINQLKEITAKREAIISAHNLVESLYESDTPINVLGSHISEMEGIVANADAIRRINDLSKTEGILIQDGVSSGFVTWDANDSGLKDGRLTLLIGSRGMGKTTLARQAIMAIASQKVNSFYFCGETSIKEEKNNLSRLCAKAGEIQTRPNLADRTLYYPTQEAGDRFNKEYAKYIHLCDSSISKVQSQLFNTIFRNMKGLAKKGTKVFLIDSMMKINNAPGNMKFSEQKVIVQSLKDFAVDFGVHIILIVHPSKHHTGTSGILEQENLADTIIRYVRIYDEKERGVLLKNSDLPEEEKKKISAMVVVEKIRDQGETVPMFMEWEPTRGAVIDVNMKLISASYQKKGLWARYVNRISDSDCYRGNPALSGNIKE